MDEKPSSIFQKFFEELKAGNPIIILFGLTVLVALGMAWVWQTISTPIIVTPNVRHPTSASRAKTLTAQPSEQSVVPASATQAAFTSRLTARATPDLVQYISQKQIVRPSLSFLASTFYQARIFSR